MLAATDVVAQEIRATLAQSSAEVSQMTPVTSVPTIRPGPRLANALGGAGNVVSVSSHPGRLRIALCGGDGAADEAALSGLGGHAIARPAGGIMHLLGDDHS